MQTQRNMQLICHSLSSYVIRDVELKLSPMNLIFLFAFCQLITNYGMKSLYSVMDVMSYQKTCISMCSLCGHLGTFT